MFGASDEDWQVYQLIRGEQGDDSDDEETLREKLEQLDADISEVDEDWRMRMEYMQRTGNGSFVAVSPLSTVPYWILGF